MLRSAAPLSPSRRKSPAEAATSCAPAVDGALSLFATKNVNGHVFCGCACIRDCTRSQTWSRCVSAMEAACSAIILRRRAISRSSPISISSRALAAAISSGLAGSIASSGRTSREVRRLSRRSRTRRQTAPSYCTPACIDASPCSARECAMRNRAFSSCRSNSGGGGSVGRERSLLRRSSMARASHSARSSSFMYGRRWSGGAPAACVARGTR